MNDPSHCFEDEELKCLIEARRCHKNGEHDMAWRLIDAAILAKYTLLAKQDKEKKDGRNSMD